MSQTTGHSADRSAIRDHRLVRGQPIGGDIVSTVAAHGGGDPSTRQGSSPYFLGEMAPNDKSCRTILVTGLLNHFFLFSR
jgi:hypothetical protein